jgi:hypothetical protein
MAAHVRRIGVGRHRLGLPGRRHCREYAAMRHDPISRRWLLSRRGRHTFRGLQRSGMRPRPVFAIIASL